MSTADDPAFPDDDYFGLSKREHAAILLRVPKSGDDEIDAMIREANRRDAAAMAMQAIITKTPPCNEAHDIYECTRPGRYAKVATACADALIAELERTA